MTVYNVAYLTAPPLAKILDRGLRTLGYLALSFFGAHQVWSPRTFIAGPGTFTQQWDVFLALALSALAAVCAVATSSGRPQFEYVALLPMLAVFGSQVLLAAAAIGVSPHVALMLSFWFLLSARYTWLLYSVRRARIVASLSKEV